MAAVSWPALVSVAGGGRVKESTEVVHEVVDRDLPHPFQSLGGTESLWSRLQLTRSLECSENAPPRFSFAFPSRLLCPRAVWSSPVSGRDQGRLFR